MAILDAKLLFSEDQALTTVGDHDSTNTIDLGAGTDAFGNAVSGNPGASGMAWLYVRVTEAFASGGAATLDVALQHKDEGGNWAATGVALADMAVADLTEGVDLIAMALPINLKRHLKMVYSVGTADMSAGAVTAWISHGPVRAAA